MRTEWRLLNYESIDAIRTQAIYHAIGLGVDKGISPNTIIFCKPDKPIICIGYHQELEKEVDLDYCKKRNYPLVRRILGGGAVYLDSNQLFYQIIAHKSDPRVPGKVEKFFENFLKAPTKTYNDIGIPASYRPVNDIEVNGRKISGNGAGEIGEVSILTGNIIFDFNFNEMVRILKVPSEKFRDKLSNTLKERMTTIKKELNYVPCECFIRERLRKNYEDILQIPLIEGELSEDELDLINEVEATYKSKKWLNMIENMHKDLIHKRSIKVSRNVKIGEVDYKTGGGLIRILVEVFDEKIKDIMITGDFWFIPLQNLEKLEKKLKGTIISRDIIVNKIEHFYKIHKIQSPLVTPDDLTETIMRASE